MIPRRLKQYQQLDCRALRQRAFMRGEAFGASVAYYSAEEAVRAALSKDERHLYPSLLALAAIDALKEKP